MSTSTNGYDRERWRRHRAARVVARNARDAEDRDELLDMLGLTLAEARFPPCPDEDAAPMPAPRPASEAERDLAVALLDVIARALR